MCIKFSCSRVEGITTYSLYYNVGVIYDVLGFREKSIECYNMRGDYEPTRNRLKAQLN